MRDAEMLVWAGDFNYRIEVGYDEALEHIRNNDLDFLIDRVSPPALPLSPSEPKAEGHFLLSSQFNLTGMSGCPSDQRLKGSSCCSSESKSERHSLPPL